MSSMFGAGFGFLFALPVLIAQWIGVIGLAKAGKNGTWWCMVVGTLMSTIGSIVSAVGLFFLLSDMSGGSSRGLDFLSVFLLVTGGMSGLGTLLFAIGFAIHGLKARRMQERMDELESVLAAQSEQLGRQGSNMVS